MSLRALGFDDWLREKEETAHAPDTVPCRVISVHKNSYFVSNGRVEVYAEATGKLIHGADSPLDDTFAVIHQIFPRKSLLTRKAAGKATEYQLIAANIDVALIVQSLDADFNVRRLERYLAMVAEGGIEPVVLFSKSDLVSSGQAASRSQQIHDLIPGVTVIAYSSESGQGLDYLKKLMLPCLTYCLIGSSGVGKTTLLNLLMGEERFETAAVRASNGKGRHVTTSRQLVVLSSGALMIDTPGMRELGNIAFDAGIEETFDEIATASAYCKFSDCSHTGEDGCGVLAAIDKGAITRERYDSFMKLRKESEFHEMSYLERRRRDKEFGKMVKSVMKQKKDRNK
jgi:ribosome biogenesis GTPase